MEAIEKSLYLDALLNFKSNIIDPETRFWMVRTKQGFFYNEFVTGGFIALGWNIITSATSITNSTKESLSAQIKEVYGGKRPGTALNKCQNFIKEMKEGDIVLIPSSGTRKITFAKVGEYYEEQAFSSNDEVKTNEKIEETKGMISIRCPYIKRRRIEVLKTIRANRINLHLMRAISNNHGLSCMDEYAKIILDEIYSTYFYKDVSAFQVAVNSEENLNAVAVTKLLSNVLEIMSTITDENQLALSINLNSPGKASIKENKKSEGSTDWAKAGYKVLTRAGVGTFVLCALVIVTGGEYKGFKANGVAQVIKDIATIGVDIEIKKQQLKGIELENFERELEIYTTLQEADIDVDKLYENFKNISEISETLEIGDSGETEIEEAVQMYDWDDIVGEDD